MNIKLKPCPFCGEMPIVKTMKDSLLPFSKVTYTYVKCSCCGASARLCEDAIEAVFMWNRRKSDE